MRCQANLDKADDSVAAFTGFGQIPQVASHFQ